jgi:hypothetical protein
VHVCIHTIDLVCVPRCMVVCTESDRTGPGAPIKSSIDPVRADNILLPIKSFVRSGNNDC